MSGSMCCFDVVGKITVVPGPETHKDAPTVIEYNDIHIPSSTIATERNTAGRWARLIICRNIDTALSNINIGLDSPEYCV